MVGSTGFAESEDPSKLSIDENREGIATAAERNVLVNKTFQ